MADAATDGTTLNDIFSRLGTLEGTLKTFMWIVGGSAVLLVAAASWGLKQNGDLLSSFHTLDKHVLSLELVRKEEDQLNVRLGELIETLETTSERSSADTRMLLVAMCVPFAEMLYEDGGNRLSVATSDIAMDQMETFAKWVNTYCPGAKATSRPKAG